ncbi:L,D-transpeptidase family protein [Labrys monachus]|uniref:Lipoprotein-anchoring transpeptidase ErfK/SrfK n=1 Tax=Labrys monachus TaxID=217067 RepID=A0ABU0F9B4_9HYPH|nr:L,D-transpeptidase family protein [Labrys monachus]MDQ0391116.1 lipoprotein-anchoring transpeptidase ErfK/SrfK [Labrys monachus]
MRFHAVAIVTLAILCPGAASAAKLDADAINAAIFTSAAVKPFDPSLVKAEILLDRAGYSPGEIDGHPGDNFTKALAAYQGDHGLPGSGVLDPATWDGLAASSGPPVIVDYEISRSDVKGPFTRHMPAKMEAMARLRRLGYRNPVEALAERFHMSPDLLRALNPHERFRRAGHPIAVAAVPPPPAFKAPMPGQNRVTRIEVDKDRLTVRAFDAAGKLVGFFPASIGSEDKPAPSGTLQVEDVNFRPNYTYNPKYKFKGVKARRPFTIAPGPNNPVGIVWIALNGEGYGIHGAPEPGKISKRYSHGCVRLTNWDALTLASMVAKGVTVDFIGTGPTAATP